MGCLACHKGVYWMGEGGAGSIHICHCGSFDKIEYHPITKHIIKEMSGRALHCGTRVSFYIGDFTWLNERLEADVLQLIRDEIKAINKWRKIIILLINEKYEVQE